MKIRRVRILLSKGWCKVVCFVSFSLLSMVCNRASAQKAGDRVHVDSIHVDAWVDEALEGKVAGFDIIFQSGDLAYGPPVRALMKKIDGADVSRPLVVLDSEIREIDDAKLESFVFENFFNRKSLAGLLGVEKSSLKAVRFVENPKAMTIWGRQGFYGVLEILTKDQYRKLKKEGKLEDDWQLLK